MDSSSVRGQRLAQEIALLEEAYPDRKITSTITDDVHQVTITDNVAMCQLCYTIDWPMAPPTVEISTATWTSKHIISDWADFYDLRTTYYHVTMGGMYRMIADVKELQAISPLLITMDYPTFHAVTDNITITGHYEIEEWTIQRDNVIIQYESFFLLLVEVLTSIVK